MKRDGSITVSSFGGGRECATIKTLLRCSRVVGNSVPSGDAYWAEANTGDENVEAGTEHINSNSQVWSAADRVLEVLRGSCEVNAIELG